MLGEVAHIHQGNDHSLHVVMSPADCMLFNIFHWFHALYPITANILFQARKFLKQAGVNAMVSLEHQPWHTYLLERCPICLRNTSSFMRHALRRKFRSWCRLSLLVWSSWLDERTSGRSSCEVCISHRYMDHSLLVSIRSCNSSYPWRNDIEKQKICMCGVCGLCGSWPFVFAFWRFCSSTRVHGVLLKLVQVGLTVVPFTSLVLRVQSFGILAVYIEMVLMRIGPRPWAYTNNFGVKLIHLHSSWYKCFLLLVTTQKLFQKL